MLGDRNGQIGASSIMWSCMLFRGYFRLFWSEPLSNLPTIRRHAATNQFEGHVDDTCVQVS